MRRSSVFDEQGQLQVQRFEDLDEREERWVGLATLDSRDLPLGDPADGFDLALGEGEFSATRGDELADCSTICSGYQLGLLCHHSIVSMRGPTLAS